MNGNSYFILVLITNVAGGGDVNGVQIKGSSSGWMSMSHNWGQNWELDNQSQLVGQAISFQVTIGNGQSQMCSNVAPSNWGFSQSFQSSNNF